MTSLPPSSLTRSGDDTADAPLAMPLNWQAMLEQQQRWWNEWLEAGQLWSSWWFSQWPSFGWPPIGVVLPPADATGSAVPPAARSEAMPTSAVAARPRMPRAPIGARHH